MARFLSLVALSTALLTGACSKPSRHGQDMVIEIATFELAEGVTPEMFTPLDLAVETQHVSKQAGFIKRQSGYSDDGEWLAVVYWQSHEAAQASMDSFAKAPAAAEFMSKMDPATMAMKRYTKRP